MRVSTLKPENAPNTETPEFIAAWEAPSTRARRAPKPQIEESAGFIAAWETPGRVQWREWKRPVCEISQEESASLNSLYSGVEA